jgi:hypothetical protein
LITHKKIGIRNYGEHITFNSMKTPYDDKLKRPKGLDPMVESEEFFTIGQGSILMRALPGAMGTP